MPESGVTVEIEGLDALIKKLDNLGQLRQVHAGIRSAGVYIKGLMTKYPPSTAANRPAGPGSRWYKRGTGSFYWRIRDNAKVSYGKKSEVLSSKWFSKYNQSKYESRIGTNVSYAKYVQGPRGLQAKALKKIGWKGIDVVAKEEKKKVAKYVFDAVKRAIDAA